MNSEILRECYSYLIQRYPESKKISGGGIEWVILFDHPIYVIGIDQQGTWGFEWQGEFLCLNERPLYRIAIIDYFSYIEVRKMISEKISLDKYQFHEIFPVIELIKFILTIHRSWCDYAFEWMDQMDESENDFFLEELKQVRDDKHCSQAVRHYAKKKVAKINKRLGVEFNQGNVPRIK